MVFFFLLFCFFGKLLFRWSENIKILSRRPRSVFKILMPVLLLPFLLFLVYLIYCPFFSFFFFCLFVCFYFLHLSDSLSFSLSPFIDFQVYVRCSFLFLVLLLMLLMMMMSFFSYFDSCYIFSKWFWWPYPNYVFCLISFYLCFFLIQRCFFFFFLFFFFI